MIQDPTNHNLLPAHRQLPESFVGEIRTFLARHRTAAGIVLDADRRLNVLYRTETTSRER